MDCLYWSGDIEPISNININRLIFILWVHGYMILFWPSVSVFICFSCHFKIQNEYMNEDMMMLVLDVFGQE